MKIVVSILGILLIILGIIWILQGVSVLPGSFMTGHILWAILGALAVILGVLLLIFAARRPASPPKPEPPQAPPV